MDNEVNAVIRNVWLGLNDNDDNNSNCNSMMR